MKYNNSSKFILSFLALFGAFYLSEKVIVPNLFTLDVPSSQQTAQTIPTSGLVAHWKFDGNATDSVGTNHGTLTNGPTFTTGKVGQAVSFDGVDDWINVGSLSELDNLGFSRENTMCAWINPKSAGKKSFYDIFDSMIFDKTNSVPAGSGFGMSENSIGYISTTDGTNDSKFKSSASGSVPFNTWTHACVVLGSGGFSTGQINFYINGNLSIGSSYNYGINRDSDASLIAGIGGNSGRASFDGLIDEVRLYNRVLSSQEISDLYNAENSVGTTPTPVPPPPTPTPPPAQDTVAPSIPTGLSAIAVSSSQINLSWNASTDNVGVIGYHIYRNNVLITDVAGTSYSNTGLSPATTYTYAISAYDAASNGSFASINVSATTQAISSPPPVSTSDCTHFASPSGGGNGLSQSSPFQIANFWSVAGPGKVLCLLDGTYTGTNSMIRQPFETVGVAGNPIVIKALNDGNVFINATGQQYGITTTSYLTVEGIDVCCSIEHVVRMLGTGSAIRRVVAWDVGIEDYMVFEVGGISNTLEDVAGFGRGRKIFHNQGGQSSIFRRLWGRWEKFPPQSQSSPRSVNTLWYNAYNGIYENVIGVNSSGPGEWVNDATWGGQGGNTGSNIASRWASNTKVLGSIAYARCSDSTSQAHWAQYFTTVFEINNTIGYYEPGCHAEGGNNPFVLSNPQSWHPFPAVDLRISNSVGIGATPSSIHSVWTQTNFREGSTIANAIGAGKSLFNEVPGICKQYQNGTLTNNPLWPWPMDLRIKNAIARTSYPPVNNTDGLVTTTITNMFGAIPSACLTSSVIPTPTPPPTVIPGDINNDGIVNSLDWGLMNSNWLTNNSASDLNSDGIVNSIDFGILNSNWLRTS